MKIKLASFFILVVFFLSFIAPFAGKDAMAYTGEKPQPDQTENDTLDDVLTGVEVTSGMTGSLVGFTEMVLKIENAMANNVKPNVGMSPVLITTGLAKVISDATGETTVGKVTGYVGDTGELIGTTTDAATSIATSYNNLASSTQVANTTSLAGKFWVTTKHAFTNIHNPIGAAMRQGSTFKEAVTTVGRGMTSHISGLTTFSKILAPLAAIGAVVDFTEAYKVSKDPKKNGWDLSEKVISGISNVLIVGALLAAGTVGAPIMAVGALVLGGAALIIKYRDDIARAAKWVGSKIKAGYTAAKNGIVKASKYVASKAKKFGQKAKQTYQTAKKTVVNFAKKTASKAKTAFSNAKKSFSNVAKNVGNKIQSYKHKATAAVKKVATKTVSYVKKIASSAKNVAKKTVSYAKKAVSSAKSAAKKTYSNVKKAVQSVKKTVTQKARSIGSAIKKTASKSYNYVKKTASSTVKKATSALKKTASYVKSTAKKATSYVSSTAKKISSSVKSTAKKATSYVSSTAKKVSSSVQKAASSVKKGFASLFKKPKFR
jgi:hypothetical protein